MGRLPVEAAPEGSKRGRVALEAPHRTGGPALDRRRLELAGHIKSVGTHSVQVRLHPEVTARFDVNVLKAK